jgi:hypothetical protein
MNEIIQRSGSWFPIRVEFTDTKETKIYHRPEDIPSGRDFKIITTQVDTTAELSYSVDQTVLMQVNRQRGNNG